jgi:cytochrome c oxidase subunit 2
MDIEELISMKVPLGGPMLLPSPDSTHASMVDDVYVLITWTCIVSFFLIIPPMVWFMWRYRRRSEGQLAESQEDHSQLIEIIWSAVPLIFFIVIFVWGWRGYIDAYLEPADAMQVYVRGEQWNWEFSYVEDSDRNPLPEAVSIKGRETFVVPAGRPVKLVMTSNDVLHSFYVPNFRIKYDVIPGRYTTVWFEVPVERAAKAPAKVEGCETKDVKGADGKVVRKALSPAEKTVCETMKWDDGLYPIFCTEYCGKDHSRMLSQLKVVPAEQYDKWLSAMAELNSGGPSMERGEKIYKGVCMACHSTDGSRLVGPSFKGLYGRQGKTEAGEAYEANDAYIKESILYPNKKIVEGYPAAMPPQKLKDAEIQSIIMYMKSLK